MSEFRINGFLQASYQYDALGRQAIRSLTSPTPVTIHSVFDSDGRRIAEYDEASGALLREYIWNGWDPVALIEGGTVYYVRADHIGRPVFATNSSDVKVWEVRYLPFGGVHTSTGNLPAARFPGQWFQSESGLHQNWMRDYDPTTGRYLEPDPLGLVDTDVRDAEVGPVATASGDLMSADGRTLLVYLRTPMPPMRLHAWISAQLASRFGVGSGIDVRVLPITANTHGGSRSVKTVVDLLAAGLAGLLLVLALVTSAMPVVTVAPNDALLEKLKSNMQEVRARGGVLYVLADADTRIESGEGVHVIRMPEHYGELSPLLHVVPLQLLAYHTALARGTDVDKPRNLAKSVTVE